MTDKTNSGQVGGGGSSSFEEAVFLSLTVAYNELVRELVSSGKLDKDAMPVRLAKAEDVMLASGNETGAKMLSFIRYGVTPK